MDAAASSSPPFALVTGVITGLAAALASAVSYLVSRHHGSRNGGSGRLLVSAHVVMGLACLPLTGILAPAIWPPPRAWVGPLLGSACCYLAGQAAVFAALTRSPASRLAPLLGLKIVMLAAVVSLLPGGGLDARQWFAVAISVTAAALLQRAGGVSAATLAIVLTACLGFAISDLCIVELIDGLEPATDAAGQPLSRLHAGCLAMAVTYVACGAAALAALATRPPLRPRDRRDLVAAVEYATAWLAGMVALYTCFGLVGAVFGNILQATRGVMAIAIGAWLARAGWHELEEQVDRATFLRRLAAATMMVLAIVLYVADVM